MVVTADRGRERDSSRSTGDGAEPTAAPAPVTLTYLVDDSENNQATTKALADAYMALHPNVTINIESRPGGTEGDNIVKTRLATGDMNDVFCYNSGSLLQALHPADTLVDLSKEPFIANIVESFLPTVSQNGEIFGVPSRHGAWAAVSSTTRRSTQSSG